MARGRQVRVSRDHRKAVNDEISRCLIAAKDQFKQRFMIPQVDYKLTGRTAGKAYYTENRIDLNSVLLSENGDTFIDRTVGHEVAHIIAYEVYGRKGAGHGRGWKNVMRVMGLSPSRCHSYDTTNSAVHKMKFVYECVGCGHRTTFGPVRHRKVQTGRTTYSHTACGRAFGTFNFVVAAGRVSHDAAVTKADTKKVVATPKRPLRDAVLDVKPIVNKVNKRKVAKVMYDAHHHHWTRKEMINKFVAHVGLTPAGASTYYSNFKRGK